MILDPHTYCPEHTLAADEQKIKARLLDHATQIGPYASRFVGSLWTDSILAVAHQARRLFTMIYTFDRRRLEAACTRALFYRRTDFMAIDAILRDNLDCLPLNPYTDLHGKLSAQAFDDFPF